MTNGNPASGRAIDRGLFALGAGTALACGAAAGVAGVVSHSTFAAVILAALAALGAVAAKYAVGPRR